MTDKKRSRAAYRRHLKSTEEEIEGVLSDFDLTNRSKLVALKTSHEDKLKRINLLDDEILAALKDEEYDAEFDDAMLAKEHCYEVLVRIDNCLSEASATRNIGERAASVSGDSITSSAAAEVKVLLPKIKLEAFDGNPLNWISFWDQFKSAVHERAELSNINKFSHLRSLLSETPASIISGLSLTNDNYLQAVELLNERYGNPQVLIHSQMDLLVQLPRLDDHHNAQEFRRFFDKVEAAVTQEFFFNGSLLVSLLSDKLPERLKLQISRKFGNDVWMLDEMLKYMKEELLAVGRSFVYEKRDSEETPFTASLLCNSNEQRNFNI